MYFVSLPLLETVSLEPARKPMMISEFTFIFLQSRISQLNGNKI